jgi:hypothetical protein
MKPWQCLQDHDDVAVGPNTSRKRYPFKSLMSREFFAKKEIFIAFSSFPGYHQLRL